MAHRHELTGAEWARIAPLPPARETRGTYYADHRRVLNGMLHRHVTGCAWRDLPARYGPWSTVYSRQRRWTRAGLWDRVLATLQRELAAAGGSDGNRGASTAPTSGRTASPRARREDRPGRKPAFDRAAYRRRSAIECTVSALEEARAVATRYEKLAVRYLALVKLDMIRRLVKRLERPRPPRGPRADPSRDAVVSRLLTPAAAGRPLAGEAAASVRTLT